MNPIERRTRPIPADGLPAAVREGRRRRRRAVGVVGAPSAALAVVVAIVLQGSGPATSSLKVTNNPGATSTATPEASASPEEGSCCAQGQPAEATSTPGPEVSGGTASPSPVAIPTPMCIDCNWGGGPQRRQPVTDNHASSADATCTGVDTNPDGYGFCGHPSGPSGPIKPGDSATLSYEFCRAVDAHAGALEFAWPRGQEHEGYISREPGRTSPRLWTWSADKLFSGSAHSDSLMPQQCFTWLTSFGGYLADGEQLAPGDYYFGMYTTETDGPKAFAEVKFTVEP